MNQISEKDIVVLYHAGCTDGFSAAWAAWKKFGDKAAYVPMEWNKVPEGLINKEIYTLDISLPGSKIPELISTNKRVTSIDHHESNEAATKATQEYLFDRHHSGGVLAWNYFHPNAPMPRLLNYCEDMDFWRFPNEESQPIMMVVTALGTYEFEAWDGLAKDLEDDNFRHDYIKQGKLILQMHNKTVDALLKNAQLIELSGHKVYSVNAPHFYASQVAGILAEMHPPFGVVWVQEKDKIHVSLRSNNKAAQIFDVSKIAQQFGGGGHPASAGFVFPADAPMPWKIIRESNGK